MSTATRMRRWDPVVKLTHWSVALAVLVNAIVTEEGSAAHIWVGYGLAAILGLRLIWGFVGPAEARFSAFLPNPRKALAQIREIREGKVSHHFSHNPLGGFMVYAIWSCLLVIIGTGIAMTGLPGTGERLDGRGSGAQGLNVQKLSIAQVSGERDEDVRREEREAEDGDREEGPLVEIHEVAANILYILILLHIAGVAFEVRRSGRQVVLTMLPFRG